MKKIAIVVMALGVLALSSCAASKPCPAYAKVIENAEVKG
jgi:hypothetical protein